MSFILLGILNAQAEAAAVGDYDLLETQILSSTASTVTFTGLGSYSDYKHLQLRMVTRTTRTSSNDVVLMTFNSDSGSNYNYHELRGNGSSVASTAFTNQSYLRLSISQTSDNPANIFSPAVTDILDFNSTSKNTTVKTLSGMTDTNTFIDLRSGFWNNTAAVTSFTLDQFGTGFEIGCRFSLYGFKESA